MSWRGVNILFLKGCTFDTLQNSLYIVSYICKEYFIGCQADEGVSGGVTILSFEEVYFLHPTKIP